MKLNKREIMLLLNSLAVNADTLSLQQEGKFPNCQSFESIRVSEQFCKDEYEKQPYLTFRELNDLFTKLTNEAVAHDLPGEEAALMALPPTEYIQ